MSQKNEATRSVAIIGTRGYPSYYGGFETAVRKLAPYLAGTGWDVTVYGRPGATRGDDRDIDDRVVRRETRGLETKSLSTLTYGLTAVVDCMIRKPDVALVMNVANGFWLPLLKLRGIPTLVNVDGIEWERAKWGALAKAVFRWGAKTTAWWADRLVFDAHAIARRWQDGFGRDGVFIPYGGEEAPTALPLEEGLAERSYALVVARFVPENTIDEFVEAASMIAQTHDVVIVGSSGYGGDLDEKVSGLATANPRVRWLGHVSDDQRLFALWQHAGAYFHGHSVGGTNPALVQAMMLGAPTVARDTVYNREVLADAGLLVPPEAAAIADTVLGLLNAPARQAELSSAAMTRARAEYSWSTVLDRYAGALRELVRTV
ncbi:glycosyltransferase involved in cell wall biosynthesis [Frigoribacterium sp. PhB160]|uniref:glycosyltransferase n=1 Tax=Frigoribacterium sp. PhB160 TaxID=2485192 RepID=UPI000F4AA586|nr:glycosyltransferase [Frigoribacterium sp. PhB160]ROS60975.1 glycosyltransferase involved in cell wall biosynthesis [Frigoribacterium sp. PhB160]